MKTPGNARTAELDPDVQKRGRGRPPKPDALTPAQRAKRFRDARRAEATVAKTLAEKDVKKDATALELRLEIIRLQKELTTVEAQRTSALEGLNEVTAQRDLIITSNTRLTKRTVELQMKFDVEHAQLVDAQQKIAALRDAAGKPPKVHPLTAEVRMLKKALKDCDASHAQVMRALRDENELLRASRK